MSTLRAHNGKVWVIQFPRYNGNFLAFEEFIKTGKRGTRDVHWDTPAGMLKPDSQMTFEEAVNHVEISKLHYGFGRQLDEARLFNTMTGESVPCLIFL